MSPNLPLRDLCDLRASPELQPHIPPDVRPRFAPHNYHILFEVEEWQAYPVDPFLMSRIPRMLFIIEAEWELLSLEADLLASMMQGN